MEQVFSGEPGVALNLGSADSGVCVSAASGARYSPIFGGRVPVVAVDLPGVVQWLNDSGVSALPLADVMSVGDGAVVAVSAHPDRMALAQSSQPGVRKISLMQSAFDADEHTVRYSISQLLASDPVVCARRQGDIAAAIKSSGGCIAFTGAGTDLTVLSRGRVGLFRLDDPIIKPGECVAAHAFFETGLVVKAGAPEEGAFTVNGSCRAAGMIVSRDQRVRTAPEPPEWVQHRGEIARCGVDLHIRDNELVACLLGGRDIKDDIARWTGADGLRLTEFSIGTNPDVLAGIDWSLNSLMNEGAQGVHVGFGRPATALHFDFICPGVTLVAA